MSWYLLNVYVHIVVTIFWVGYALFWTIMIGSLRQSFNVAESARLARMINQAPWPPKAIPAPYRVKFSGLGWVFLLVLVATGISIVYFQGMSLQQIIRGELFFKPFGRILAAKLVLVVVLMIFQISLTYQPVRRTIYLNMLVTLLVVALSALLVH